MRPGALLATRLLDAAAILLAAAFLLLAGRAAWTGAKSVLADRLIGRALAAHLQDGRPHSPWGWADIHPLAVLEAPRLGVRHHVLSGASGSSLAFGLGHVDGTGLPNGVEHCVLAGHRDTRAAFLADLRPGDELILTARGGRRAWTVEGMEVVPEDRVDLLEPAGEPRLTLITCFPFDGLTASSQRYVVRCRPEPPA